jgi:hypothetical protein
LKRHGDRHATLLSEHAQRHQQALESHGAILEEHKGRLNSSVNDMHGRIDNHKSMLDQQSKELRELEQGLRSQLNRMGDESLARHKAMETNHDAMKDTHTRSVREMHDALRAESTRLGNESKGSRQEVWEFVTKLRDDMQQNLSQQRLDATAALGDLQKRVDSGRAETDGELQALRLSLEDMDRKLRADIGRNSDQLRELVNGLDGGLRSEIMRTVGETKDGILALRALLDQLRADLTRRVDQEKSERGSATKEHAEALRQLDDRVKGELAQASEESRNVIQKQRDLMEQQKQEHRALVQATHEELEAELRRELAKGSGDVRTRLAKLAEAMDDQKALFDKQLAAERQAREEQRSGIQDQLSEVDRQLHKAMSQVAAEAQASSIQTKEALAESFARIERQLGTDRMTRDEQRAGLQESLEQLDRELHKEVARLAEAQQTHMAKVQKFIEEQSAELRSSQRAAISDTELDLRKALARIADDAQGRHAAMRQGIEESELGLRTEMRRVVEEQSARHMATIQATVDRLERELGRIERQGGGDHARSSPLLLNPPSASESMLPTSSVNLRPGSGSPTSGASATNLPLHAYKAVRTT